jgi:hypothetical protein
VKRWRRNAKYYAAKLIKSVPRVALISVQKPEFQPEIAGLFTDWIHQIADWYAPSLDYSEESSLFAKLIREHAKSRPIIIYLGAIAREKGFEFFTDLLCEDRMCCSEFAFVAAGKVSQNSADIVHRFITRGGLLVDRYISDNEFVIGIEAADWVWNCYPPENDQNSGIFGFAYRAGARVIVRDDSYISRAALDLQFPTVQIRYSDVVRGLEAIRASRTLIVEKPKQAIVSFMKERTRQHLRYHLGCSSVYESISQS